MPKRLKFKISTAQRGFTLIELLFSFLLIILALLITTRAITFCFKSNKKSFNLVQINEELNSQKDYTLSQSFEFLKSQLGESQLQKGKYNIHRRIRQLSPSLLKIELRTNYRNLVRKMVLFKSKIIKEVEND